MKNFISLLLLFMISTGVAQAVDPPVISPSAEDMAEYGLTALPDNFTINIYSEDGGTIYYQVDPSPVPTTPTEVKENGTQVDELASYGITLTQLTLDVGEHTVYAVREVDGELSEIVSETYSIYKELEWQLVTGTYAINPIGEYIIVNSDRTMVAGSFENGHFTAVPCENNVTFDPNMLTATVNTEGLKVFKFDDNYSSDTENFIKDTEGTYYTFGETEVSIGKSQFYADVVDNGNIAYFNLRGSEGGNALSFNDNFGMYADGSPVLVYARTRYTLADILTNFTSMPTIYDDLLAVVFAKDNNTGIPYLWCKDLGNRAIDKVENPDPDNIVDFMKANNFMTDEWDQSNWIALDFSYLAELGKLNDEVIERIKSYEGMHIKPGTLRGEIQTDRGLHQRFLVLSPLDGTLEEAEGTERTAYTPNVYCPANFLSSNHDGNVFGYDENGETQYFFMTPKIEEVCKITYAVWDGNKFVMPAPEGEYNPSDIPGAFNIGWSFNKYGNKFDELEVGQMYEFNAIVRYNPRTLSPSNPNAYSAPVTPGQYGTDWKYDIQVVNFNPGEVITGVDKVKPAGNGVVKSVKYVSVAGVIRNTPFQGVNIVVTEYTDGSRTTSKIISK